MCCCSLILIDDSKLVIHPDFQTASLFGSSCAKVGQVLVNLRKHIHDNPACKTLRLSLPCDDFEWPSTSFCLRSSIREDRSCGWCVCLVIDCRIPWKEYIKMRWRIQGSLKVLHVSGGFRIWPSEKRKMFSNAFGQNRSPLSKMPWSPLQ
jgi:hypothetical protein